MKIDATLAGLTPKVTGTGRVIEVKLITKFSLETLRGLGELFAQTVTAHIGLQQPELEMEQFGDGTESREGE